MDDRIILTRGVNGLRYHMREERMMNHMREERMCCG
jgi:hypothetical protein